MIKRFFCYILLFLPFLIMGQSKIEILKSKINKNKIEKIIHNHINWYRFSFKIDKGRNKKWSFKGSEIWYFPKYSFKITPDSTIINSDLLNLLEVDKNEMFSKGWIYFMRNGVYNGRMIICKKNCVFTGIIANDRFNNDKFDEENFKYLKSLKLDFIFSIKGFEPSFFYIKNDSIKVISIPEKTIYDITFYFKNKINFN